MPGRPKSLNKCKCGRVIKKRFAAKCPTCAQYYREIKKTVQGKTMTENQVEVLTLKKTRLFRKRMNKMSNGG